LRTEDGCGFVLSPVRRASLLAIAFALLAALAAPTVGARVELMPGVTYDRVVKSIRGKRVIMHVVVAPKPGGLYALQPVLSNDAVLGSERVSSMQRRIKPRATTVGVNGDLFNFRDGYPTGIFMRDGILRRRPVSFRSSLGIGLDGMLRMARVSFLGSWGVGDAERTALQQLNGPLERGDAGLYTDGWGGRTPTRRQAVDIVVSGLPAARPNVDLAATVAAVRRGGGTSIPSDGAVLQVSGPRARTVEQLAVPGAPFVTRLVLKPWWEQVRDAIGGGPALIRDGRIALPTTEGFTSAQLLPRHPRTAVGQRRNGQIVLVVADGRRSWTAGVTLRDLARELLRLRVVTAMAMDAGGSSTLAFDGRVLNSPSDGAERPVSNSLMVFYYGAYAPALPHAVVSPNGDGVDERQRLRYKLVRPSTVEARLVGPRGRVAWRDDGPKERGVYAAQPDLRDVPDGRWTFVVRARDDDGNRSKAQRTFTVNRTLGFLQLSAGTIRRGGSLGISFRLAHDARVRITVSRAGGAVVRTLLAGERTQGEVDLVWNGRHASGSKATPGRYVVSVQAQNRLGGVTLSKSLTVRR
jgi:hypothetical protein